MNDTKLMKLAELLVTHPAVKHFDKKDVKSVVGALQYACDDEQGYELCASFVTVELNISATRATEEDEMLEVYASFCPNRGLSRTYILTGTVRLITEQFSDIASLVDAINSL